MKRMYENLNNLNYSKFNQMMKDDDGEAAGQAINTTRNSSIASYFGGSASKNKLGDDVKNMKSSSLTSKRLSTKIKDILVKDSPSRQQLLSSASVSSSSPASPLPLKNDSNHQKTSNRGSEETSQPTKRYKQALLFPGDESIASPTSLGLQQAKSKAKQKKSEEIEKDICLVPADSANVHPFFRAAAAKQLPQADYSSTGSNNNDGHNNMEIENENQLNTNQNPWIVPTFPLHRPIESVQADNMCSIPLKNIHKENPTDSFIDDAEYENLDMRQSRKNVMKSSVDDHDNEFYNISFPRVTIPRNSIIGNESAVNEIRKWFNVWSGILGNGENVSAQEKQFKKSKKRSSNDDEEEEWYSDVDNYEDSDDDYNGSWGKAGDRDYNPSSNNNSSSRGRNTAPLNLLLVGPTGSGKSDIVYLCAKESSFNVLEVNPSDSRQPAALKKLIGEASQSRALKQNTVILIDEVDILSNEVKRCDSDDVDEDISPDKGFLHSLRIIMKNARCPIILTCNRIPLSFSVDGLGITAASIPASTIYISRPTKEELTQHIISKSSISEQHLNMINEMVEQFDRDVRQCTNSLDLGFLSLRKKKEVRNNKILDDADKEGLLEELEMQSLRCDAHMIMNGLSPRNYDGLIDTSYETQSNEVSDIYDFSNIELARRKRQYALECAYVLYDYWLMSLNHPENESQLWMENIPILQKICRLERKRRETFQGRRWQHYLKQRAQFYFKHKYFGTLGLICPDFVEEFPAKPKVSIIDEEERQSKPIEILSQPTKRRLVKGKEVVKALASSILEDDDIDDDFESD